MKKEECDSLYSNATGRFTFETSVSIPKRSTQKVQKIKIRNRLIPLAQWVINKDKIKTHVSQLINENGAIYTDDLTKASGLQLEILVSWLKHNGFVKHSKKSKRWENKHYNEVINHELFTPY
jgi:hypothetical protein